MDDPRVEKELIEALLKQGKFEIFNHFLALFHMYLNLIHNIINLSLSDRLGWSPVMAAIKADSGAEEIVAMFLTFLEPRCDIRLLHNLLTAQNIGKVRRLSFAKHLIE